jgi:hypothetical protein
VGDLCDKFIHLRVVVYENLQKVGCTVCTQTIAVIKVHEVFFGFVDRAPAGVADFGIFVIHV